MDVNVCFVGGFYSSSMEERIIHGTRSGIQTAANRFQWALLKGLQPIVKKIDGLSVPFIAPFPNGSKFFVSPFVCELSEHGIRSFYRPFINLWGYRSVSRLHSLKRFMRKNNADVVSNSSVVIAYSCHTPILGAAIFAKKLNPKLHVCLVVPDLPQYMNLNEKKFFLYKFLKEIDNRALSKLTQHVDSFVLLTKQMRAPLNIGCKPSVILEAIALSEELEANVSRDATMKISAKRIITYTGTLNYKFGIMNLVRAFQEIKGDDLELCICGSGEAESDIQAASQLDRRICYKGVLSAEATREIQRNSSVLVNPRKKDGEYTKYSFPSKNMEYLLSGRPVVAYKLEGIPDDYDDFFVYVLGDTNNALRDAISRALSLSPEEVLQRRDATFLFLKEHKTERIAAARIMKMITQNSYQPAGYSEYD